MGPDAICIVTPQMIIIVGAIFFFALSIIVSMFYNRWDELIENAYEKAFDTVDADKSGFIEEVEVELAVVLLYSEVNAYVRIRRPKKEVILEYFRMVDVDNNKKLDRGEFRNLMKLLGASIAARGATMIVFTILSPLIAATIIDGIQDAVSSLAMGLQASSHSVIGEGCLMQSVETISQSLPFLDEQLITTILTLVLVKGVAPALFTLYDTGLFATANTHIEDCDNDNCH